MRKFFMSALAMFAMMGAMSLTSCSDDDDNNGGGDVEPGTSVELGGIVEGTMTLDASKEYHLTSALVVPEGATLEIPAGTTIKAAKGFGNYILVERGGTIKAEGTEAHPIVMTADDPNATSGYWGGLIINGYAPISGETTGTEGMTEISNTIPYGGTEADDNSGIILCQCI